MKKKFLLLPICLLFLLGGCNNNAATPKDTSDDEVPGLVTFLENTLSLPEERSYQLHATIDPSLDRYLRFWSSENTGVATVTNEGLVTAVKKGITVIVLQCGKSFARCAVEVTDYVTDDALSVSISKDTYNLEVGDDYEISPTVKYGSDTITDYTITADSSNTNVATFDTDSLTIHAVGIGSCDILLTFTYLTYSVEEIIYVNVY